MLQFEREAYFIKIIILDVRYIGRNLAKCLVTEKNMKLMDINDFFIF